MVHIVKNPSAVTLYISTHGMSLILSEQYYCSFLLTNLKMPPKVIMPSAFKDVQKSLQIKCLSSLRLRLAVTNNSYPAADEEFISDPAFVYFFFFTLAL